MKRAQKDNALHAASASICMAFPETVERLSHGAPTFFAGGKKTFVMFLDDHHGDGRLAIWCAAPPGVQATLVDEEPGRFFVPPYVGTGAGSVCASTSTSTGTRSPASSKTASARLRPSG